MAHAKSYYANALVYFRQMHLIENYATLTYIYVTFYFASLLLMRLIDSNLGYAYKCCQAKVHVMFAD